ncbi:MAG TPA: MEDS domain-containing protein [Verrucomicrobiae bacterium]|jgi:hypothetical protein|nr:MEDS domain-containing protein [Verrucomicrobiae bacterium]
MKNRFNDFTLETLKKADAGSHLVQIYGNEDYLVEAVAVYAHQALTTGGAVILIATPAHLQLFRQRLEPAADLKRLEASGLFRCLDARQTLARFMKPDGQADYSRFSKIIGSLLEETRAAHPEAKISAYGEMVNLLWQEGNVEGAIWLEECWNALSKSHAFSLFCAYHFADAHQMQGSNLKEICRVHSHYIVGPMMEKAVSFAIQQVLREKSPMLKTVVGTMPRREKTASLIPGYLSMLLWLDENMPQTAAKIKAAALEYLSGKGSEN